MPKYLPSAFVNEIEPARRRQKKVRRNNALFWILIGALLVTILHFTVESLLVPQAHAQSIEHDDAWYCAHLGDYTLGDKAVEIVKYCESDKFKTL